MSKIKKLNYEFDKISYITIFFEFLKLGLTSFGGPIAHIGFFREYFVKKKKVIPPQVSFDHQMWHVSASFI